jgi:hypothetical protein
MSIGEFTEAINLEPPAATAAWLNAFLDEIRGSRATHPDNDRAGAIIYYANKCKSS